MYRLILGCILLTGMIGCGMARSDTPTVTVTGERSRSAGSLQEAIALARALRGAGARKPIVIQLPAGTSRLAAPLLLSAADAGTAAAPLIIRGQDDGSSIISGAVQIGTSGDADVSIDLAVATPQLRPIPTAGFDAGSDPATRLFLFEGDTRLKPAAWPAEGYATGWTVLPQGAGQPRLAYNAGVLPRGDQLVLEGFPFAEWQHEAFAAQSDGHGLRPVAMPDTPLQPGARLRLLNVPSALAPGRYFLDGSVVHLRGIRADIAIEAAVAPSLFVLDHADHIRFEEVALEKTTGTAIKVVQSAHVSFSDCYVGLTGGYAVEVDGGEDVRIERCVVTHSGAGGIRVNGGDRPSLTAAHHLVGDSAILLFGEYLRSYAPGIALTGVGNIARHNLVAAAPHAGIILAGNDHLIDGNELASLACETSDASAIYMGRDWSQRGNRIVGNYIHDLATDMAGSIVSGVYLDDQFSGTTIADNLFLRMPHGVFLGGGRDNVITGNHFALMGRSAIWIDDRGLSWQKQQSGPNGILWQRLEQSPYRTPLWRQRYPRLATLSAHEPGAPIGNSASDNVTIGSAFLWASPMTLTLAGKANLTRPLPRGEIRGSATEVYHLLGKADATPPPGPTARLLYEERVPRAADCGTARSAF